MAEQTNEQPTPPTRFTVREVVKVANEQRPDRELRLVGNVIKRVRKPALSDSWGQVH